MYRRILLCSLSPFFWLYSVAQGIPPVGQWREHLPYNNAIALTTNGNLIICATPYSLFSYDTDDNSFQRFSKINGLSEVSVAAMGFEEATGQYVLAYQNSNVDFIKDGNIRNVPDIKLTAVSGDKSIYQIFSREKRVYLSTGLGVIVLNAEKYEVAETYRIGVGGNNVRVNAFTADADYFYAATVEGLKKAPIHSNLTDFNSWTTLSGSNGLAATAAQYVLNAENKVLVQQNDSVFVANGTAWNFFYDDDWSILHIDFSGGKILLSEEKNGQGRVVVLNNSGTVEKTIELTILSRPRQSIIFENDFWVADQNNGMVKTNGTEYERVFPNSPINTASGEMIFDNNELWVAAGSVNDAWNYTFNPNGLFHFAGDFWDGVNLYVYPQIDSLFDFITVAADRQNGSIYAGSYGGGLLEIKKDRTLEIYKQNSLLQPAIGDPGSYRVSGLATDQANNLWITNFGAPQDLVVKKADGNWQRFTIPFLHSENAVSQILVDDYDQKWIVSPKGNGVFCFNHGNSIDNTGDDQWKFYRLGKGNGNLPSNTVLCIAKDLFGFIWVGTDNGIGIVQCGQDVFSGVGCDAEIPIVQQDNFAGYLFQGEEVRTIAVDGANRKWVGTRNGVWLISEDGQKTIYRFTEDNSPLLSNDIKKIGVDPKTGEVFIETFNGICSFRGTATVGSSKNESVLVFPNPVPPGYSGTIAIRGLVNDAFVKIVELNGRLVYQTRAAGGQATWNGKDYKGNRVSSGAYLVLVADETNQQKVVTKIFFIK